MCITVKSRASPLVALLPFACGSPHRAPVTARAPASATSPPSIRLTVHWDHRVSDEIEIYRHSTDTTGAPYFAYEQPALPAAAADGSQVVIAGGDVENGVEPGIRMVMFDVASELPRPPVMVQSMKEFQGVWRNREDPAIQPNDAAFAAFQTTVEGRLAEANATLATFAPLEECVPSGTQRDQSFHNIYPLG